MQTKVAIVTGASSGIGKETALALINKGYKVYGLSRHDGNTEGIHHIDCDVSLEEQVFSAISTITEKEGHIDILINNAGFGISGATEFTKNEDAKHLLDVNLFGVVNGCRAVIPVMRNQGHGRIVNISSVAAVIPIPFQTWYSVSKSAIRTYTSALQCEVKPFGISLCTAMPGDISSGFTAAREKSESGDEVYGDRIRKNVGRMENDEMTGMSTETAGEMIAKIATKKKVKPEYALGFQYKLVCVLERFLPNRFKAFVISKMYAN